jgi:Na+-driven multidrug efflux pump
MRIFSKGSGDYDELRAMVALAVPVVLVQLGFMSMGVVDTLMVGRVSARVLAAVALGNLYFFNVSIFAVGTLMALDPIVAQAVGAGDVAGVSRAMQRGLLLSLALSVLTAALLAPATSVLRALHQPAEIIGDAAAYVRISIAGIVPYLAFVVLRQSLQAMHRVAPVVWTMIVANLTNAGFNWVFVYGHLGSPALGVAGSSLATAISRWVMTILLLVVAWPELRPNLVPIHAGIGQWAPLRRMLRIGAAIGGQQALEVGAFGAIGLLMGGGASGAASSSGFSAGASWGTAVTPNRAGLYISMYCPSAEGIGSRRASSSATSTRVWPGAMESVMQPGMSWVSVHTQGPDSLSSRLTATYRVPGSGTRSVTTSPSNTPVASTTSQAISWDNAVITSE